LDEFIVTTIRIIFFFIALSVCIYATIFYDSSGGPLGKKDWSNFSFKHDWGDVLGMIIGIIIWSIVIYFAVFYGIGLERDPYYR
jgi:hypothetical protein